MTDTVNTRRLALDVLVEVTEHGAYSNQVLRAVLEKYQYMEKYERAFLTRLVEGTIQHMIELDYVIDQFSKVKVKKMKPVIRNILRLSVYQICYMDSVPDSAACNEAVKLARKSGFSTLSGFVNGVLRNIARNRDGIKYPDKNTSPLEYYSVEYSVPVELVEILLQDYDSETVDRILGSSYEMRQTSIRVNTDRISVDEVERKLEAAGIETVRGSLNDTSLLIKGYDYVRRIPGFMDGEFVVQDQSSCLAVRAAGIQNGDLVVDVCAAPGGKTMYAASLAGQTGMVISRDLTENKTELIEENVDRLGLTNVTVEAWDARDLDENLVGKADVVIADLPCSGLGIMGRKNDIKYNVTGDSIDELAQLQRDILDTVSRYVKTGGTLVYSTCTIDSRENQNNVKWFVENHDFETVRIDEIVPGHGGDKGYVTLLQGVDECDGFFISKFVRTK